MQTAVNRLVQAVEVWRPLDSENRLAWFAGAYDGDDLLGDARRQREPAAAEGAVGRAFAEGLPQVRPVDDEPGEDELRSAGVSHVVAIPSMQSGVCRGVVSLLCEESDRRGAFEVWRPNERSELAITSSWYANLDHFGVVSRFVKFPRRAGLPGRVWADRFPRVMGSLGSSPDFVRVAGAKAGGLSTALGIPFMRSALEIDAVLVLLSAARSPIANVIEVWALDGESGALRVVSADYGPYVDLAPASRRLRPVSGEGIVGRVLREGAPWASDDLSVAEPVRGAQLIEYGFEWSVGMPLFVGDALVGVVTLMR